MERKSSEEGFHEFACLNRCIDGILPVDFLHLDHERAVVSGILEQLDHFFEWQVAFTESNGSIPFLVPQVNPSHSIDYALGKAHHVFIGREKMARINQDFGALTNIWQQGFEIVQSLKPVTVVIPKV